MYFETEFFVRVVRNQNQGCFTEVYSRINLSEAATRCVLCKKVFLEITQNSQGNTCAKVSFLVKLQASGLQLY